MLRFIRQIHLLIKTLIRLCIWAAICHTSVLSTGRLCGSLFRQRCHLLNRRIRILGYVCLVICLHLCGLLPRLLQCRRKYTCLCIFLFRMKCILHHLFCQYIRLLIHLCIICDTKLCPDLFLQFVDVHGKLCQKIRKIVAAHPVLLLKICKQLCDILHELLDSVVCEQYTDILTACELSDKLHQILRLKQVYITESQQFHRLFQFFF